MRPHSLALRRCGVVFALLTFVELMAVSASAQQPAEYMLSSNGQHFQIKGIRFGSRSGDGPECGSALLICLPGSSKFDLSDLALQRSLPTMSLTFIDPRNHGRVRYSFERVKFGVPQETGIGANTTQTLAMSYAGFSVSVSYPSPVSRNTPSRRPTHYRLQEAVATANPERGK